MKFFTLAETATKSGLFELSSRALDAPSTSEALAVITKDAKPGLRVAVAPYRAISGTPEPIAPTESERGKTYDLLLEKQAEPGIFASDSQVLSSQSVDAASLALGMQYAYGRRVALMAHSVDPSQSAPPETTASAPAATSGVTSGSGSGAQTSGASVSSGGSATSGGSAVTSGGSTVTSGAKGS